MLYESKVEESKVEVCNVHLDRSFDPPHSTRIFHHDLKEQFSELRNKAFGVRTKLKHEFTSKKDKEDEMEKKLLNIHPMPHAISIDKEHLKTISSNPYTVCDKSDGVRYIFGLYEYLDEDHEIQHMATFEDRAGRLWRVSIKAPSMCFVDGGTFVDGEMVWDTGPYFSSDGKDGRLVFLIFDIMCISGNSVRNIHKNDRMKLCRQLFGDTEHKGLITSDSLHLVCKRDYDKKDIGMLFDEKGTVISGTPGLSFKTDGLILNPADEHVNVGTHWTQFKWKQDHTIDFRLQFDMVNDKKGKLRHIIQLLYRVDQKLYSATGKNKGIPYAGFSIVFELEKTKALNTLLKNMKKRAKDGEDLSKEVVIVETSCSPVLVEDAKDHLLVPNEEGIARIKVRVIRHRLDKDVPNNSVTILRTLRSMEYHVSIDDLRSACTYVE